MTKKAFQVQVELDLQAVTCPGVWLCANGNVSLQLYMLDSCVQTASVEPIFPLLLQEKYIFYKTFISVHKLTGLQKLLNKETLYVELIQWQHSDAGNVLATFQTTLTELLFPTKTVGCDVDLLMDPMDHFPGIIAPKIEVSTKTVIEDKICSEARACPSYVVNPCRIQSMNQQHSNIVRQKKVCHSVKYHRSHRCPVGQMMDTRPPFVCRRVDENLIHRRPNGTETNYCNCKSSSPKRNPPKIVFSENCHLKTRKPNLTFVRKVDDNLNCGCDREDHQEDCPVCAKYKYYFDKSSPSLKSTMNPEVLCNYSSKSKPSLAGKIHSRLLETLGQKSQVHSDRMSDYSDELNYEAGSLRDSCTVSSFGDFYKKLYGKAASKCQRLLY
ncbi:PREDICTED: spermatogenesis associated 6-like protein [Nicrophorus vespilloides]|uniref:Spermatogenesis associated 6-like protein n=1 Tax=Nicrophorus vespilloides TaxID=110193 RepID=A0ABM1MB50_NICVS|nr:PREDICTED: spermatogenesis associated 6-like protein [Nicrophorus vespilloides]